MYAVLETGSKQYRVSAGDRLEIERLAVEAGQPVTFDRILLLNHEGKVTVGWPTVALATVGEPAVTLPSWLRGRVRSKVTGRPASAASRSISRRSPALTRYCLLPVSNTAYIKLSR